MNDDFDTSGKESSQDDRDSKEETNAAQRAVNRPPGGPQASPGAGMPGEPGAGGLSPGRSPGAGTAPAGQGSPTRPDQYPAGRPASGSGTSPSYPQPGGGQGEVRPAMPGQPRPAGGQPGQPSSGQTQSSQGQSPARPSGAERAGGTPAASATGSPAPPKPGSAPTGRLMPSDGDSKTQRIGGGPAVTERRPQASRAGTTQKIAAEAAASSGAGTKTLGDEIQPGRRSKRPQVSEPASRRRGRTIKFALLGAGVLAAVLAFALQNRASKTQTPQVGPVPQATQEAAKVGETVERANLAASVLARNLNFVNPNPAIKPDPGKKFVVVEFKLTNKDTRAVTVSAARQFKLKDSTEARYEVSPKGAPDPKFPDGTVAPGQTVSGWIAFQVPQDSTGFRLLFNPSVPS